jgi:tape measure domain-containing protein
MSTEGIDIVVTKTGADEAAVAITSIGDAGTKAAQGIDTTNQSIGFMKSSLDAATPATAAMNNALGQSDTVFRAAEAAAKRLNITVDEYNAKTQAFIAGTNAMNSGLEQTVTKTEAVHEANTKAAESSHAFGEATTLLKEALGALGLIFTADKILEISEAYQKTDIQLRSVSASTKDLTENQARLQTISQLTGTSYASNVQAFQKLTIETHGLGISQKDLLTTLQNVDAVVQESGGTSREAAQAVSLFSRALATGSVSGRQFRTLLLDFPQLGQLAAQGLGTTTGALVSLSQKAGTTSKEFVEGFNKAAAAANVAGKEIDLTLNGAITKLQNSVLLYIGRFETANGLTQTLSHAIAFLADNFSTVAAAIEIAVTAFTSFYGIMVVVPGILALATSAMRAFTAAALANPFLAIAAAIVTVIALVYEFGNSIKLNTSGSITLLGAFIGVWNVLKNVLTNIWALVSGPLGTAFSAFFALISAPFRLLVMVIQGVLTGLEAIGKVAPGTAAAFDALVSPVTKFKQVMTDSMEAATAKLNETTDSTKKLGSALDGDADSLNAAATNATKGINGLVVGLTQMGRVNAAAIEPFTNLVKETQQAEAAFKNAQAAIARYNATVAENNRATADLSVTTRDAMGNIIKYVNEAANQTGSQFDSMKGHIDAVTQSLNAEAAAAANVAASSGGGGGGGSGGTSSMAMEMAAPSRQEVGQYFEAAGGKHGGADQALGLADMFTKSIGTPNGPADLVQLYHVLQGMTKEEAHVITAVYPIINTYLTSSGLPTFANGGAFDVGGAGGTDSQLVQFMASPNETVTVETPEQRARARAAANGGGGRSIVVNMDIKTPDPGSFRRSKNQMLLDLRSKLNGV